MVCGFTVDVLYIIYCILVCVCFFFFSSRRRHTRCALVTGVQTCALPICWLFPESDHNPRAKAIRAAIKHAPGQTVSLHVNGKPADPLTFEGLGKSADGGVAVSLWRGLEIREGENRSEEHTSELQSLMRISYAVFCLKKKTKQLSSTYAPTHYYTP